MNIQLLLILIYDAKIYQFCPRRRYHYDVIRIVTFIPETPKLQCICFIATLETLYMTPFLEKQQAQLVLTSKQFSECTEHINLWHLQTTSTWGKGGIKNSMKNTEKRFLLVGTYHENKTRWITLYSQSFNIVKLSCYIFKRLNQFVLRVLAMLFTHNFYLLWLYFGDEQFCDPWFFLKPNQW